MPNNEWEKFIQEQQRKEQEAANQAREQLRQWNQFEQLLAQQLEAQHRFEERRQSALQQASLTCHVLEQELRQQIPIDQIAANIRNSWLGYTSIQTDIIREPNVHLTDVDFKDRSRVGRKLSYSHEDTASEEIPDYNNESGYRLIYSVVKESKVLSFGLGIFGSGVEYAAITPFEYDSSISEQDRNRGVKGFFVKSSGLTYSKVIPLTVPGAVQHFYKTLYDFGKALAPGNVLPEASQRVKAVRKRR